MIYTLKKVGEYNLWLLTRARKQGRIYNGDECKIWRVCFKYN